jgi:Transient receptor potential (TRP) ion channel
MVLAAIVLGMLFFKLVLEFWAMCGHLSPRFENIRRDYWRILSTTIVRILLIVYGTSALYCLYQFRAADSWAASLLAAITFSLFTLIILFFIARIFYLALKVERTRGVDELYEHEPYVKKYGFFYDQFKSRVWWFFVPILVVPVARAFLLVFAGGNGMVQAIGILALEGVFLLLLFWRRPYDGRGANVVNAMIAVVRVLSIVCILVFVDQLGIRNCCDLNGRNFAYNTDDLGNCSDCGAVKLDGYSRHSSCCRSFVILFAQAEAGENAR